MVSPPKSRTLPSPPPLLSTSSPRSIHTSSDDIPYNFHLYANSHTLDYEGLWAYFPEDDYDDLPTRFENLWAYFRGDNRDGLRTPPSWNRNGPRDLVDVARHRDKLDGSSADAGTIPPSGATARPPVPIPSNFVVAWKGEDRTPRPVVGSGGGPRKQIPTSSGKELEAKRSSVPGARGSVERINYEKDGEDERKDNLRVARAPLNLNQDDVPLRPPPLNGTNYDAGTRLSRGANIPSPSTQQRSERRTLPPLPPPIVSRGSGFRGPHGASARRGGAIAPSSSSLSRGGHRIIRPMRPPIGSSVSRVRGSHRASARFPGGASPSTLSRGGHRTLRPLIESSVSGFPKPYESNTRLPGGATVPLPSTQWKGEGRISHPVVRSSTSGPQILRAASCEELRTRRPRPAGLFLESSDEGDGGRGNINRVARAPLNLSRDDVPLLVPLSGGTTYGASTALPGGATAFPLPPAQLLVRWKSEGGTPRPLVRSSAPKLQNLRTSNEELGARRLSVYETRGLVGDGSDEKGGEDERGGIDHVAGAPLNLNCEQPPDEIKGTVWQLLAAILSQKIAYKNLLESKGQKAQVTIDILRKSLDSEDIPEKLRPATLSAMMRLCTSSGVYPKCFELGGVHYDTAPVASGSFGDIWKGYLGTQVVSLKVARVYAGSDVEDLIRSYSGEAILWSQLNHPNVLPFYGIYYLDGRLGRVGLVSPWMQNGNVNEYLKANPEAPRMNLVHDIFAGLSYLHERSVVHGDLKGANILISPDRSARLADFGLSSIVHTEILRWTSLKSVTKTGGTARWEAPELMDELEDGTGPRPTFLSDVYSAASVMYEVLTGQVPYYEFPRDTTVMMRVIRGIKPSRPTPALVLELSDEVWDVMEECWNQEPSERPTVAQAAIQLREIPEHELTTRRAAAHNLRERGENDLETGILPSRVFRDVMRGDHLTFSQNEIDLLREYQG